MGNRMQMDEKLAKEENIIQAFKEAIDIYRMEHSEDTMLLFNEFGYLLIYRLEQKNSLGNGWNSRVERGEDSFPFNENFSDWPSEKIEVYVHNLEEEYRTPSQIKWEQMRTLSELRGEFKIRKASVLRQLLLVMDDILRLQEEYPDENMAYDVARQILELCVSVKGGKSSYILPDEMVRELIHLVCWKKGMTKNHELEMLDPQCGPGTMLIAAQQYLGNEKCRGIEEDRQLWISAQILIILSGAKIKVGGEEFREEFLNKNHKYDFILANPPFISENVPGNVKWGEEIRGKHNLILKGSLCALKENGTAVMIVPDSFLFSSKKETTEVRRWMLRSYQVDAVITLPAKTFSPNTRVRSSVLVIQNRFMNDGWQDGTSSILFYRLNAGLGEAAHGEEYQQLLDVWRWRERYYEEWQRETDKQFLENAYDVSVPGNWKHRDFWFADIENIKDAKWMLLPKIYQPVEEFELKFEEPDKLLEELITEQENLLTDMGELLKEVRSL